MKYKTKIRVEDERRTNIVTEFLEKYFYPNTEGYQKIDTVDEQIKGIDSKFTLNGVFYNCDEKAAVRYRYLNTFALEISFINTRKDITDGWFVDKNKVNNSYLFVWIDEADSEEIHSVDEIHKAEIALVKKENIAKYLRSLGFDREKLVDTAYNMRANAIEHNGNAKTMGYKFTHSMKLNEAPINVLIPRKNLIKMSDFTKIYNI